MVVPAAADSQHHRILHLNLMVAGKNEQTLSVELRRWAGHIASLTIGRRRNPYIHKMPGKDAN